MSKVIEILVDDISPIWNRVCKWGIIVILPDVCGYLVTLGVNLAGDKIYWRSKHCTGDLDKAVRLANVIDRYLLRGLDPAPLGIEKIKFVTRDLPHGNCRSTLLPEGNPK